MFYTYQNLALCESCGLKTIGSLESTESDQSDYPLHCDYCKKFLQNKLSSLGHAMLCNDIVDALQASYMSPNMREHINYYNISLKDLIQHHCGG